MKTISLFLLLVCGSVSAVSAADVSVYAVSKLQGFAQTTSGAPVPLATGGFSLTAIILPTGATVTSATIKFPNAVTPTPFGPVPGFGPFAVVQRFNTLALLDAACPNGDYLFTINTVNDGPKTPTLAINGDAYPNAPAVTNFTPAQNIDWTLPFTLQWGPMTGGTTNDTIQLIISRKNGSQLYSTPQFGSPGSLNGTATSAVIPANILVPGEPYTATLIFGKIVAVNQTYTGVPGVSAYSTTTEFPMKAPGTTPTLVISTAAAPGSFDLTWNADIGRTYDLVWAADLSSPITWTRLALVTAPATTATRNDTPPGGTAKRFYRLQQPP